MRIDAATLNSCFQAQPQPALNAPPSANHADNEQLRESFNDFVGQTFFGQMLQAMRNTVGKSAYFDGGRAEEIFTQQLDQVLAEKISEASAEKFTGPMYELFTARWR